MAYTKQGPFADRALPAVTGARANAIDQGIADAHAGLNVPLVTSLTPGVGGIPNPVTDGFRVDYLADSTNGVIWPLRYRSASGSAYKWEVVGTPPALFSSVDGNTTVNTRAYSGFGGPSLVVPLAGDYEVTYGGRAIADAGAGGHSIQAGFTVNGTLQNGSDVIDTYSQAASSYACNTSITRLKTGLPAGATLSEVAQSDVGNAGLNQRWLRIMPRRVG